MSERTFRLIQGLYLFATLFIDSAAMMWGIIIIYLFEGITNWRIPVIMSRLIYQQDTNGLASEQKVCIPCDAERMQRLFAAFFLYLTFFMFPDAAWFGPWFLAAIFTMAGLTNVCPSVMFLRWLGFR